MVDWNEDISLARALHGGLKRYFPEFIPGDSPPNPASRYEAVNSLYYSPHAILSHDQRESINFFNLGAQAIFGYSLEEAVGMNSIELVPIMLRQGREKLLQKVIEGCKMVVIDTQRIKKDGRTINIRAHVFPYELFSGIYSIAAVVEKIKAQ
ncbi:MEKHLA domain-containing protein [Candidatus Woesearchaeota archaeon]|nr:MEKHLA domain-containing protein [Candidatus Woesearchaeota archaeon]